jgi:hypothetical protein
MSPFSPLAKDPFEERLRAWRGHLIVPAILAALHLGLLMHTAWEISDTVDESTYVGAASWQWAHGDFLYNCEAPALPKWGFGATLRMADRTILDSPKAWDRPIQHMLWSRSPEVLRRNLFSARVATVLAMVLGGLLLFFAAMRFGLSTAIFTHALFVLSPNLLAHGSLVTLDGWATVAICGILFATIRCVEKRTLLRTATLGLAIGVAAASKVPTLAALPVVGLILLAMRLSPKDQGRREKWLALGLDVVVVATVAFFTLWFIYGFTAGRIEPWNLCRRGWGPKKPPFGPMPFPMWIEGVIFQWAHGAWGHKSFLLGEIKNDGWWYFYLVVLALKTTLAAQLVLGLRLFSALRKGRSRFDWLCDVALLAFPLLLIGVMSAGKAQNGVKYILPAFPCLMLWGARCVTELNARWSSKRILLALGLTALLSVGAVASVHPHHLMFFNLWAGGPEGGPRYLVHGDDWGQGQRQLAQWQRENDIDQIFYTYAGGKPRAWGVRYENKKGDPKAPHPPCTPTPGIYALHAIEVHRPDWTPEGCLDWLTVEEPDERLGYSIYIYRVDQARIERLKAHGKGEKRFWRSGKARTSAR